MSRLRLTLTVDRVTGQLKVMKRSLQSLFLTIIFLSPPLWATIPFSSLRFYNVSGQVLTGNQQSPTDSTPSTTGNATIYGGIAGPSTVGDCSTTATGTCNNCIGDNMPCNTKRILPSTELIIEFQTDKADSITTSSTIFLIYNTNEKITGTNDGNFGVNKTLTFRVPWGKICAAAGAGVDCATSVDGAKTFQVGISTNDDNSLDDSISFQVFIAGPPAGQTSAYQYFTPCFTESSSTDTDGGYCYMEVERGDEKVYINNEAHAPTFNRALGGIEYSALRVYYGASPVAEPCDPAQFQTLVTSASPYVDLSFKEEGTGDTRNYTFSDNIISGLENETRYYFRFANVDVAGNVYFFSGDQSLNGGAQAGKAFLNCEKHSKKPSKVVGLLDDEDSKQGCFIATAAYGSPMAPQVNILRAFRDQYLLTNALGRWLVKQYYTYSPHWAKKIKKRDGARAAVRVALSPVVVAAQWVVHYGLQSFLLLSSLGFMMGFLVMRRILREND